MENNLLMFSSLIFITNGATAFYKKYYIYSLLFILLTITAFMFHYDNNMMYTNILDKIFILAIVLYGMYILYGKKLSNSPYTTLMIVLTFLFVIFLFFYGYCVNDYCFHPDKHISNMYHCMLHIVSSFGHHLIIFL